MTTRRSFLSRSLGVAVLGGTVPEFLSRAAFAQPLASASADPANVLVVVQMGGGNDGLNTVIPYSDDVYHRVRPTIAIGETAVLRIDDRIAFNPVMAPLDALYKDGRVAIVQGVSYPNPNRSHFEATQIWETGSPQTSTQTGWLGRYLDRTAHSGDGAAKLFRAIALGDTVPTALAAEHVDVPAVGALGAFAYLGSDSASKTTAGRLYDGAQAGQSPYLELVETTARTAMHGGDLLRGALASIVTTAPYPPNPFAQQLRLAARIVRAGIGTRIIFVSIGSFDTHAGQRAQQDRLLGYLAAGLSAFYADLQTDGMHRRVLAMTFSEFGRRVAQNASNGTDHGTAMPMFVVGGNVRGGVYGDHPSLVDLDDGDLKMAVDFRAVYATVLERWLGYDPATVIAGHFDPLAFV